MDRMGLGVEAVAAPATVSGEFIVHKMATGKPGRPDGKQRPASQETCQRSHPTDGRGVHTERLFAAVTLESRGGGRVEIFPATFS